MAMHKKSKGMARGGKSMMSKGYARGGTKARTMARKGKTKMAAKGGKMTLASLRKMANAMGYKLVKKA